jgi:hypothetical protein
MEFGQVRAVNEQVVQTRQSELLENPPAQMLRVVTWRPQSVTLSAAPLSPFLGPRHHPTPPHLLGFELN